VHVIFSLDTNAIFQNYQWYRWIVGQLTFASLGETIVGCLWITHMSRRFEREMGSRKFLVWWLGGVGITSLLLHLVYSQVVVIDSYNNTSIPSLHYSGPYPLVGALLLLFHIYTPRLHPKFVGCCGVMYFSEKSLGYLFCAQILFYHGSSSIIPCFLGAPIGLSYHGYESYHDLWYWTHLHLWY
jgi:membrane associated rhomboid family serine protease